MEDATLDRNRLRFSMKLKILSRKAHDSASQLWPHPFFFVKKASTFLNKVLGQSITFTLPSLPVWFLILHHASLVNIHNSNHLSFPISSKLYLVYWFYVSVFKKLLKALFHYIYIYISQLCSTSSVFFSIKECHMMYFIV